MHVELLPSRMLLRSKAYRPSSFLLFGDGWLRAVFFLAGCTLVSLFFFLGLRDVDLSRLP